MLPVVYSIVPHLQGKIFTNTVLMVRTAGANSRRIKPITQIITNLDQAFLTFVIAKVKPVYNRLSNDELLKKCLDGKTQNQNESLNSMIWNRLPKGVFVGATVLTFGVYDAVAHFNIGSKAIITIGSKTKIQI